MAQCVPDDGGACDHLGQAENVIEDVTDKNNKLGQTSTDYANRRQAAQFQAHDFLNKGMIDCAEYNAFMKDQDVVEMQITGVDAVGETAKSKLNQATSEQGRAQDWYNAQDWAAAIDCADRAKAKLDGVPTDLQGALDTLDKQTRPKLEDLESQITDWRATRAPNPPASLPLCYSGGGRGLACGSRRLV